MTSIIYYGLMGRLCGEADYLSLQTRLKREELTEQPEGDWIEEIRELNCFRTFLQKRLIKKIQGFSGVLKKVVIILKIKEMEMEIVRNYRMRYS